jgi:molecular chaperone GrpE (heat shock protein)
MTDFSSVNLRILSPDGKQVLAELQTIDKVGQRAAGNATAIGANMRKSVTSARQLAFAATGVTSGLTGAVGAAGNLAESIAMSARNAKLAAGAGAIGALVSVALMVGVAWKKANDDMKEWNATMNQIASQTKIADLTGISAASDRLAKIEAITQAADKEVVALEKISNKEERAAAIVARRLQAQHEILALDREINRERQKAYEADVRQSAASLAQSAIAAGGLGLGPQARARFVGVNQLSARRDAALSDLSAEAQEKGYSPAQLKKLSDDIVADFANQKKVLEAELADMAGEVGQTFVSSLVGSIGDGITAALAAGGTIGDGFKAMTAGMLAGLGDMMVSIGTESLLAAKLMSAIVNALRSFAPEGAIGPSLALIAAGSVLKGFASRIGGSVGGSGASRSGYGSSSGQTIVERGLINPLNPAPNTAGLRAVQPINITALVYGSPDDPTMQRHFLNVIDAAQTRRGG